MLTKFPAYYVMGANTEIGKTIFSTGLCMASVREGLKILYLKPVQTGFPLDSDSTFVKNYNSSELVFAKTIFSMSHPISPHRALPKNMFTSNSQAKHYLDDKMISILKDEINTSDTQFILIEGSGGVASPTLQGQLQCDVYRELRLPIVFIADSRLGGISCTISSITLAEARGFEVACVLLFEGQDENANFIKEYYKDKFPVFAFKDIPDMKFAKLENIKSRPLDNWYKESEEKFSEVFQHLTGYHLSKVQIIDEYIEVAKENIWWPFTQHSLSGEPRVIDSAFRDDFSFVDFKNQNEKNILTKRTYDASASWWTQGVGHASSRLSHAAATAAGRYGHVMFPGNVHEPVAKLTQKLISTVGRGWAKKVFFSDNGSTAVEVALKIAFRKSLGMPQKSNMTSKKEVFVLGLKDSYHGDTHAAMDATHPNVFKKSDHWYNPRGYWLDYPTISLKNGKYIVSLPECFLSKKYEGLIDETTNSIFSEERLNSNLAHCYLKYIHSQMEQIESAAFVIGALLLEPVIQGSGGMIFVDPLFQKLLIIECRKRKIPIIFDEVFTGFWRLGKISASHLLNEKPDIACYAKLLTGGLLPLSVTLAREEFFQCFLGDSLSSALLHGHSYTATPVGCAVAVEAIEEIQDSKYFSKESSSFTSMWNEKIVSEISFLSNVERVFALGSIFAFALKDNNSGYASTRSKNIVAKIQKSYIDVRPLGNVIYILAGFNTSQEKLNSILEMVYELLKEEGLN